MNRIPCHLQNTLFGKFFYSPSLFTHHTLYRNKVFDMHFEWSRYDSKENIWPPFFRSIVRTKMVKEVIEFDDKQNMISYRKENKNDNLFNPRD